MGKYYEIEIDEKKEIIEPKKFKVLILNDDYSTMDFVVNVLINIFKKDLENAKKIMLNIHTKGKAICGVYTYEIATTKILQVRTMAKNNGFPLEAIVEED